jgi:aryl sulfotransferase
MIEPRKSERSYRTWTQDSSRWDAYTPRASDIVIATPPKCGTTWTQRIVSLLIFQSPAPCPVMELSPWIDASFIMPREAVREMMEAQSHRRFLKSHLPFDGVPIYDEVRYIHVARDPRDACMSFFNHLSNLTEPALDMIEAAGSGAELGPFPRDFGDLQTFWRTWFTRGSQPQWQDGYPEISFVDFETSYWRARRRENLLLVHYNDLKADLDGEMRRIAAFLGIDTPLALWPRLVEAASFEAMKRDGAIILGPMGELFEGGSDRFLFKGSNGRWKDELSPDDLALADKLSARFSPGLRRWLEGGRRAAGDPAKSAD